MKRKVALSVCIVGLTFIPDAGRAAGYAIIEQSVKGLGNAFAGGATSADDASTIFFNPAGMTRLSGNQGLAAANIIVPGIAFKDQGSRLNAAVGGAPLQGGDGGNGGDVALVPNFYYMYSWDENLKFGIGLNAPYGLSTTYEQGWVGRYHALRSELTTINLNPAVAYKVNDVLSVGAGLNVQYADVTLTNSLDFSSICLGSLPQAIAFATCSGLGLVTPGNPATDGYAKLVGNSLAFGFNLGFTLEPVEGTRLGAHYRSHIEHDIKGSAHFLTPSRQFTQLTGAFVDTDAKASLPAPDTVSFGFTQAIGSEWSLMGDITWTQWSRFDSLTVDFENPAQPTASAPTLWEDTFRYSLGTTYRPGAGSWTYRLGFAYDESPISVLELRTPRIPDVDRIWMSFGATYKFTDSLSLDFGYAHLFLDNAKFNNTEATGHTLVGQTDLDIDIIGFQLALNMP